MSIISKDIEGAIERLKNQDIVAIPTETVYGLAGNGLEEKAIKKIFSLKKRPLNHPLILHVHKNWDISNWVIDIPDYAKALMHAFWPGPLTLIFQIKPKTISPLVTGGQDSLALRCPAHPSALTLLERLSFPLVAPSANPFGKISPTTALHVQESFPLDPLFILDGGRCEIGIESSIIDARHKKGYQILRQGMLNEKEIQNTLAIKSYHNKQSPRVPGKLNQHYQPQKPLYCFDNSEKLQEFYQGNNNSYVIFFNKINVVADDLSYELPKNPKELAYELYYQLRKADHSLASCIAIELPPDESPWQAIRERLLKASHWDYRQK